MHFNTFTLNYTLLLSSVFYLHSKMTSVGALYVQALSSCVPALLLMSFGILMMVFKIYELNEYNSIQNIAFSISLAVRCIFVISTNTFDHQDWLFVLIRVYMFLIMCGTTMIISLLYKKGEKLKAFASIVCILSLNNSAVTGIPILEGLIYSPDIVPKFAYLQMLPGFLICLIPSIIFFELSIIDFKQLKTKNNSTTIEKQQIQEHVMDQTVINAQETNEAFTSQPPKRMNPINKMILNTLIRTLTQPMVIAMLVGLIFNAIFQRTGKTFPEFMDIFFVEVGCVAAPFGLFLIGMYLYIQLIRFHTYLNEKQNKQIDTKLITKLQKQSIKDTKQYQFTLFILVNIYIQLFKHLAEPMLFTSFSHKFNINDEYIVELNSLMLSQPTSTYSFVLCTNYGFGQGLAGVDSIVGIFTAILVIPIIQVFNRNIYGQ